MVWWFFIIQKNKGEAVMDFSVFPSEYENKARAESRNKIEQVKKQSDDRIRDFESKLKKRKPMPGICAVVVGHFMALA